MRIYNFSKVLASPFALVFGIILYKSLTDIYFDHSLWMIPFGLILVMIYVFSPQIDHWWHLKYPVSLDEEIKDLLKEYNPMYNNFEPENAKKFENRMSLFMHSKDFYAMGTEKRSVPYDLKAIISQVAMHIIWAQEQYMYGDFDRIVIYKHPFPSPQFPFLHAMETHIEDGVIILSLQHLEAAVKEPDKYYHVIYHVFIEAFMKLNPSIDWPSIDHLQWEDLEKISKFPTSALFQTLGFKSLDLMTVMLNYYFVFPHKFATELPQIKANLDKIFRSL